MGEAGVVILWAVGLLILIHIACSLHQIASNFLRKSGTQDDQRDIQVIVAGQDDLLIFRSTQTLRHEQREELRDLLVKACAGRKCFVLENGISIEAVVQADAPSSHRYPNC